MDGVIEAGVIWLIKIEILEPVSRAWFAQWIVTDYRTGPTKCWWDQFNSLLFDFHYQLTRPIRKETLQGISDQGFRARAIERKFNIFHPLLLRLAYLASVDINHSCQIFDKTFVHFTPVTCALRRSAWLLYCTLPKSAKRNKESLASSLRKGAILVDLTCRCTQYKVNPTYD